MTVEQKDRITALRNSWKSYAEIANTKFLEASCGEIEDESGDFLYTVQWTLDGPTDRIWLFPIDDELRTEFYENSGVISEEHKAGAIYVDLE